MERIAREVHRDFPELERRFSAMSYEESYRDGGNLASRGIPRLPDAPMLEFMQQRARLLGRSEASCSALFESDDGRVLALLESLPDDQLRAWLHLTARAQQLELRGGPRPLPRAEAERIAHEALARVRGALSPEEATRWDAARSSTTSADACFVERTLLRVLLAMSPDEAARLHRALMEVGVSSP
ncbi:MAG: hypothetical protein K8H88_09595 [Sandaracinaceae bacterium]|nr:hypothetical protein [Sandaracinaceae bacterium]